MFVIPYSILSNSTISYPNPPCLFRAVLPYNTLLTDHLLVYIPPNQPRQSEFAVLSPFLDAWHRQNYFHFLGSHAVAKVQALSVVSQLVPEGDFRCDGPFMSTFSTVISLKLLTLFAPCKLGHPSASLEVDCCSVGLCLRKNVVHPDRFRHWLHSVYLGNKKNVLKANCACYEDQMSTWTAVTHHL